MEANAPAPRAELLPAWFYICDNCGEDQFERVVIREGERNGKKTLEALPPARVICGSCGTVSATGSVSPDCR